MELPANRFKAALKAGKRQIGLWSAISSALVAEAISRSGFDWIVLDMEHGPNEVPGLIGQMQAMQGGTATAVVRPPWNDFVAIKRILDAGAQSLVVPYVQNRGEAQAAVRAVRYPPAGVRGVAVSSRATGFGRIKDYARRAADEICLIVQVETSDAMARLDEIAGVDGVDGVFIGPSDLAASMGELGNPNAPKVQEAIRAAAERLQAIGKPAGILSGNDDDIRRYAAWGYQFIAVGTDMAMLARSADALAAKYRSL
jgi:4-hydroxy-2-oxoheptanedioate aldolase